VVNRKRKLIIILLFLMVMGCSVNNNEEYYYSNLSESINNVWKTNINIILNDLEDHFIIFTDDKKSLMANTYKINEDNKYNYSSNNESGFQFKKSKDELGFVWNVFNLNKYYKGIWGVVYEPSNVSKIEFEFIQKDNKTKKIIEINVTNNAFYKKTIEDISNKPTIKMYSSDNKLIKTIQ
jgi:hypothetical protein